MRVVRTVAGLVETIQQTPKPLGLVPTMGSLHRGHMALVQRARSENASLVVTIFVNPTQFDLGVDLAAYPRDIDGDLWKLERAGVDIALVPPVDEVYPPGFDTYVDVGRIAARLEGEFRPNHFRGVATVVCKLLSMTRPDRVYFGAKDAQQCLVVKRLNADLDLGTEIVVVPTLRDAEGLALSSRNIYLNPEERKAASVLYRSLCLGRDMWEQGERNAAEVRKRMRALVLKEPLARIDYVSIADAETLEELEQIVAPSLVSLAVHIGRIRFIDNITL